jgi:hypothetical protein
MSLDEFATVDEGGLAEIAALLGVPDPGALAEVRTESLRQRTHRQLLEASRRLGLSGISRLTKDALAAKLGKALPELARRRPTAVAAAPAARRLENGAAAKPAAVVAKPAAVAKPAGPVAKPAKKTDTLAPPVQTRAPAPEAPPAPDADSVPPQVLSHKFEVGHHGVSHEEPRTIPWSYTQDRVTAMPVDPERLFVYWEVTDDAIARARTQLGAGGPGAWLNLRVYDVSGRLFDGTNAHGYFDHKVERHDRQWFFAINKPDSQAIVDLGLRSHEGYFVKVARSSRVEFPRRGPVGWTDPEWMSVRASGEVESAGRGAPGHHPGGGEAHHPGGGGPEGGGAGFDRVQLWSTRSPWEQVLREAQLGHEERVQWEEVWSTEAHEMHRTVSWESPMMVSSWEAGPFTYPVEVPQPTSESFEGALKVYKVSGRTHVLYGPWQVVIRGLGAQFSRQVLARWEVQRSWVAEEGHEVRGVRVVAHQSAGSSEMLAMGASERWWRGASELRLQGASERYFLAASERRLGGASETLFAGASQWLARGASERRLLGASELRMRGSSELMYAGASERRLGGASEGRIGGGSESRFAGGSEGRIGGGSEARLADGEATYPTPPSLSSR